MLDSLLPTTSFARPSEISLHYRDGLQDFPRVITALRSLMTRAACYGACPLAQVNARLSRPTHVSSVSGILEIAGAAIIQSGFLPKMRASPACCSPEAPPRQPRETRKDQEPADVSEPYGRKPPPKLSGIFRVGQASIVGHRRESALTETEPPSLRAEQSTDSVSQTLRICCSNDISGQHKLRISRTFLWNRSLPVLNPNVA